MDKADVERLLKKVESLGVVIPESVWNEVLGIEPIIRKTKKDLKVSGSASVSWSKFYGKGLSDDT